MSNISMARLLGENQWLENVAQRCELAGVKLRRKKAARAIHRLSIIDSLKTIGYWRVIADGGVRGMGSAESYGSFLIVSPSGEIEFGYHHDRNHINSLHAELWVMTKAVERCIEMGMRDGGIEIIGDCSGVLDFAEGKFPLRLPAANELKGRLQSALAPMTVWCVRWDRKDIEALFGH